MLEIDGVRAALSFDNTEETDGLADAFLQAVELGTKPRASYVDVISLIGCLGTLKCSSTHIVSVLQSSEHTPGLEGVGRAYESALNEMAAILNNSIKS